MRVNHPADEFGKFNQKVMLLMLKKMGHKVDTASNGLEATFNEKPNLIRVVDLNKLILHEAFTAENNA